MDTEIAIHGNDVYVAYQQKGSGNKPFVKKLSGANWVDVGADNTISGGKQVAYLSFAVSPNAGIPYVAYRQDEGTKKIKLMKYADNQWQVVAENIGEGTLNYVTLEIDSAGIPYVAYYDTDLEKIVVRKFKKHE